MILGAWTLLIAVVWLGVLPRVTELPAVAARIATYEARGIDPSALFYTEQDVVAEVLDSLDRLRRRRPNALWVPAGFPHWTGHGSADIFRSHE